MTPWVSKWCCVWALVSAETFGRNKWVPGDVLAIVTHWSVKPIQNHLVDIRPLPANSRAKSCILLLSPISIYPNVLITCLFRILTRILNFQVLNHVTRKNVVAGWTWSVRVILLPQIRWVSHLIQSRGTLICIRMSWLCQWMGLSWFTSLSEILLPNSAFLT